MRGFTVFLGKEFREIFRTWRIWVLPVLIIFVAIISPVTVKMTPALLESISTEQSGVIIQIPDPTAADAYLEWIGSLFQMATLAIVISMGGMIAGERKSGTAILVLTKPVSRGAMVLAKVVSNIVLLTFSAVLGTVVCYATTVALFDGGMTTEFLQATAVWYLSACSVVALMAVLSVLMRSQAAAAGIGLGIQIALAILAIWRPARDYSPAGLSAVSAGFLSGDEIPVLWPALTGALSIVLLTWLAIALFRRKEL